MVHVAVRYFFHRFCTGILGSDFTVGIFPCDFRYAIIHDFSLFLVRQVRIECQYIGNGRVCVCRSQFPTDLDNGTVNLDTQKVFRLPCDRNSRTERNDTIDVRHRRLTDERIAAPCTSVLPSEAIGCLAILHDSR